MAGNNGRLSKSNLTPIPGGFLNKDAGAAWNAMYAHILRATGEKVSVNGPDSSYRVYSRQVFWKTWWCNRGRCGNAATPGTSNHGWGLAVDVPTRTRQLIDRYGAEYGWAKKWSDAQHEPWHLKYKSGVWSGKVPPPLDPLNETERRLVNELQTIRKNHGKVWGKEELARANAIKKWLLDQRKRIKDAAKKDGWKVANRSTRYKLLLKAYKNEK